MRWGSSLIFVYCQSQKCFRLSALGDLQVNNRQFLLSLLISNRYLLLNDEKHPHFAYGVSLISDVKVSQSEKKLDFILKTADAQMFAPEVRRQGDKIILRKFVIIPVLEGI